MKLVAEHNPLGSGRYAREEAEEETLMPSRTTIVHATKTTKRKLYILGFLLFSFLLLVVLYAMHDPTKQQQAVRRHAVRGKTPFPTTAYEEDNLVMELDEDVEYEQEEEEEEDLTEYKEMAAPRSMPELVYDEYEPTKYRYMVYQPAGGMSNQIMELENALGLAKLLNRTLYVPRISSHSNFASGYNKQGYSSTFPADKLLDFNILSQYTRVVPINLTLQEFMTTLPDKYGLIKTDYASYGYRLETLKSFVNTTVLYFDGYRMWKSWFSRSKMTEIKAYVGYSQHLRAMSMRIAKQELGDVFYAIHGRLGDQKARWKSVTSAWFVRTNRFQSWNVSKHVVYLASDNPRDAFFTSLRANAPRVVTLEELKSPELAEFSALFDSPKVRSDMLGVLDKLICIQANDFIGTGFSTFTWDIQRYRGMRDRLFPELNV